MYGFFSTLMFLAMGAVLVSLVTGIFVMFKGGALNKKYSQKLMRLRVILQGVAILFFILALLSK